MKKSLAILAILGVLPLAAEADVTKEEIRKLAKAGLSDDVIVAYIRAHGPVQKLSAEDIVELKQSGASDKVLAVCAGETAPAKTEVVVKKEVLEKQVIVPQTTYVYERPAVFYTGYWCGAHLCYDSCSSSPYYPPAYYYSSYACPPRVRYYSWPYTSFRWGYSRCW